VSQLCRRGVVLVVSLMLTAPQVLTLTAAALDQTVTVVVNCADAVPAMDALRAALDDDAAAADLLAKLKEAAKSGRAIDPEELDRLAEDVLAGLESGVDQTEQAVVRTAGRIDKLNLNRREGRRWPEHTKSIRAAANQLRQDLRRVPRSGKPMRFVNGRRSVSESRGFALSPQARASETARPTAATQPFNRVFQSATGFWNAVKDSVESAHQDGLDAALADEEPLLNLLAQVPRLGENLDMIAAARVLAGVGFETTDGTAIEQKFAEARLALDRLERTVRAACAQQTTQNRESAGQTSEPRASSGSMKEGNPATEYIWWGVGVGGGLYAAKLWEDSLQGDSGGSSGGSCGPRPSITPPAGQSRPTDQQLANLRSWCSCQGLGFGNGPNGFGCL
jgi:hypothetical protein